MSGECRQFVAITEEISGLWGIQINLKIKIKLGLNGNCYYYYKGFDLYIYIFCSNESTFLDFG